MHLNNLIVLHKNLILSTRIFYKGLRSSAEFFLHAETERDSTSSPKEENSRWWNEGVLRSNLGQTLHISILAPPSYICISKRGLSARISQHSFPLVLGPREYLMNPLPK